ncbi:hypothetical protein OS493_022844 [Desmophyllum pertusum]|uniref:Uncharacterized protein n=1 Tax=Desmophyllum pertusum TaxID=174260 RepID=A0A9W9ZMF2_9CNID|nr:hypothetical protein OS493_022844 [Desmophyllum pertusum]
MASTFHSLRLPLGIGLDCSPCEKRIAPSCDVGENDLKIDHDTPSKKMKRLSLSDEDVIKDKIGTNFEDVMHRVQSVTQDVAQVGEVKRLSEDVTHNVQSVTQDAAQESLVSKERKEDDNCVERKCV